MKSLLRPAFVLLAAFSVLTGIAYPALVTLVAQTVFPEEANGSLVSRNGAIVGSLLVGQPFDDPRYFSGRPSATPTSPYNAGASSGSNLGPSNPALAETVRERVEVARSTSHDPSSPIPIDLVTASASGLDPHISPASALFQVKRVAAARGLAEEKVRALVERSIEPRDLGVLGEPRVNVLRLNLALDEIPTGGA